MTSPTELRVGIEALTGRAARELEPMWATFSTANEARDTLRRVLPTLVRLYGTAAASWAADWYDSQRYEQRVSGTFRAVDIDVGDAGARALAGWGVGPLYAADPDWESARVLIAGGLQRRIANAARLTIAQSAREDPHADGWQRIGSGKCDLCRQLLAGADINTADRFVSHDHCHCEAVPAWSNRPRPVKPTPLGPPINKADAARARVYLRRHHI